MDHPAQADSKRAARAALDAWAIIALCVGVAFYTSFALQSEQQGQRGDGQRDLQLRFAVGMYQLAPPSGERLLSELDASLGSQASQIRVAVVAGEIAGAAAASGRLAPMVVAGDPLALRLEQIYRDGAASLPAEDAAALRVDLGWLGEVALVHGRDATDPDRIAILAAPRTTALRVIAVNGGGLALLVAGIVASFVFGRRWRAGRMRAAYPTPVLVAVRHPSACIEGFALYLVGFTAYSLILRALGLGVEAMLLFALFVPLVLYATVKRGMSWADLRQAVGLHSGRGVIREAAAGVLGWIAGIPLIAVGMLGTLALSRYFPTGHPIEEHLASADAAKLMILAALAALWAPVVEETMFRGLLFHHLRTRWAWLPAALVTSGVFAALHPQGVAGLPALVAVALVMAGIRAWRGSLIAPIAAHATHNGLLILAFVLLQR